MRFGQSKRLKEPILVIECWASYHCVIFTNWEIRFIFCEANDWMLWRPPRTSSSENRRNRTHLEGLLCALRTRQCSHTSSHSLPSSFTLLVGFIPFGFTRQSKKTYFARSHLKVKMLFTCLSITTSWRIVKYSISMTDSLTLQKFHCVSHSCPWTRFSCVGSPIDSVQPRLSVHLDLCLTVSRDDCLILRNVNPSDELGKLLTQFEIFPCPRLIFEDTTHHLESPSRLRRPFTMDSFYCRSFEVHWPVSIGHQTFVVLCLNLSE